MIRATPLETALGMGAYVGSPAHAEAVRESRTRPVSLPLDRAVDIAGTTKVMVRVGAFEVKRYSLTKRGDAYYYRWGRIDGAILNDGLVIFLPARPAADD